MTSLALKDYFQYSPAERKSMFLLQHKEDLKIGIKGLEDKSKGGRITGKDVHGERRNGITRFSTVATLLEFVKQELSLSTNEH